MATSGRLSPKARRRASLCARDLFGALDLLNAPLVGEVGDDEADTFGFIQQQRTGGEVCGDRRRVRFPDADFRLRPDRTGEERVNDGRIIRGDKIVDRGADHALERDAEHGGELLVGEEDQPVGA